MPQLFFACQNNLDLTYLSIIRHKSRGLATTTQAQREKEKKKEEKKKKKKKEKRRKREDLCNFSLADFMGS